MPTPWSATDARYSGNVEKSHGMPAASAATSMSSTFSSVRAISSWCSARVGRDREPAVARDHGGDPVVARRRERGIPEHLRVVVRVDVDEARRHDAVAGVEHLLAVEVRTDLGDPSVGDADVGPHARCARAVVDGPALDHQLIRHVLPRRHRARRARHPPQARAHTRNRRTTPRLTARSSGAACRRPRRDPPARAATASGPGTPAPPRCAARPRSRAWRDRRRQ